MTDERKQDEPRSAKGLLVDKRFQAAVMLLLAAIASYFGLVQP